MGTAPGASPTTQPTPQENLIQETLLPILSPVATIQFIAAVVMTAILRALRPSTWTPMVREVLVRQIYFTGVGGLALTCIAGLLVGISVVAQAGIWLAQFDQSALFGPLVANVVIQNLGPLLVNFFIIGRSGTAIATELANMAVHHEIEVIDSQGIDPFDYLVVPRVIGMGVSVLSLTVMFNTIAIIGGYVFCIILRVPTLNTGQFARGIFLSLTLRDFASLAIKAILPGVATGAICCMYGLRCELVLTGVPQAGTRAAVASVWALLFFMVLGTAMVIL